MSDLECARLRRLPEPRGILWAIKGGNDAEEYDYRDGELANYFFDLFQPFVNDQQLMDFENLHYASSDNAV